MARIFFSNPIHRTLNDLGEPRKQFIAANYNDELAVDGQPLRLLALDSAAELKDVPVVAPLYFDGEKLQLTEVFLNGLNDIIRRLTTNETNIGTNASAITANTNAVTALTSRVSALETHLPAVIPGSFASDAAAASGGVPVGGLYHNTGVLHVRLS